MRVEQLVKELSGRFAQADLCFGHGTDNAYDEACYLVFEALDLNWQEFASQMKRELSDAEYQRLNQLADRRITEHVPMAYLTGRAWFAGLVFRSDERALVPRSPIAELIENHYQPLVEDVPATILDLCCGGGCIGIATALQFSASQVDLTDIAEDALQLAQENVHLHGVAQRVRTVRSDLFAELTGRRYNLIVSNPPYVGAEEYRSLPEEFRHEPRSGLLCDDDGLAIPLQILRQSSEYLEEQGILILEVGYSGPALVDRCPDVPFLWLEFEHGGDGVLMLNKAQLLEYRDCFV